MDESSLDTLQSGSEDDICKILAEFAAKNAQTFSFPTLDKSTKQKMVDSCLLRLQQKASSRCYASCLETLRILSREKSGLEMLACESSLKILLKHSGIETYASEQGENITVQGGNNKVIIEAQKSLCNIIYNSPVAQRICTKNGCIEGIVQRLKTYKDPDLDADVKYFDMKILFLLTALCAEIRPVLRFELHGFTYLIEVLDLCLKEEDIPKSTLSDRDADLSCEVLKVLFNLTVAVDKNSLDEEEEAHFMRLVSVLHDLLLIETATKDKKEEVESHTVNLLTNMPRDCYEELLTPLTEGAVSAMDNKEVEYDGKNMEAIVVLLEFLNNRLDTPQKNKKESLTPILHCLCETCRANRCIRKFCRSKVLPPLRSEVKRLPEEGHTLRNKLCKLLTNPIQEVKELVADFLFVMCKENVNRMVKYTGYGNAAGLLASRGLMCGGKPTTAQDYSSDSEDSDTEEYGWLRDQCPDSRVNPVTGRWEQDKPNPLEGMSEEQKEYEAMELVNMMDKLCKTGIIQPSMIGPDGKPHPIEHVFELAENAPAPPAAPPGGDEDELDSD
ncbi:synembryn-A-like isoform X1 [Lineus longissimus]|uniref:synembryn-A-like isoform X1 n=2 Tax=Lineus longissimus TaxID=88925 RepID=UPI002B4D57FA